MSRTMCFVVGLIVAVWSVNCMAGEEFGYSSGFDMGLSTAYYTGVIDGPEQTKRFAESAIWTWSEEGCGRSSATTGLGLGWVTFSVRSSAWPVPLPEGWSMCTPSVCSSVAIHYTFDVFPSAPGSSGSVAVAHFNLLEEAYYVSRMGLNNVISVKSQVECYAPGVSSSVDIYEFSAVKGQEGPGIIYSNSDPNMAIALNTWNQITLSIVVHMNNMACTFTGRQTTSAQGSLEWGGINAIRTYGGELIENCTVLGKGGFVWDEAVDSVALLGDVNVDFVVDAADLGAMVFRYLDDSCEGENNSCDWTDLNGDGEVNLKDFGILAQNWSESP